MNKIQFRHKGLEDLYNDRTTGKIDRKFWKKLLTMLNVIETMENEDAIKAHAGWAPHKLHGKNPKGQSVEGHWSLKVSGNWRLTYMYTEEAIIFTDFMDYH